MRAQPQRRAEALTLLGIVLILGVAPFWTILDQWPWGADATKWLSYGSIESPRWPNWVFFHKHFIGYRPVTALTYVFNSALGGYRPFGYRLFDLVCHALVGVGLWGILRLWTQSRWALLAPVAFFLHPATEVVVPYVSRRSYPLGLALGLGGLAAFTLWLRAEPRTHRQVAFAVLSTALIGLGLFANETVFVLLPLLPFLALHLEGHGRPWRRRLGFCLPAWAMGSVAAWTRFAVLGKLGGYEKYYFAFTEDGRNKLRSVADPDGWDILSAAWSYALFPSGASGQPSLVAGQGGFALLVLQGVLLYYVWQVVIVPLRYWRDPNRRGVGLAGLWFGGLTVLYALTGTWFWRQGYPLAAPFGLVWAWVLAATISRGSPARRCAHALPQVALLTSIAWHSPILGLDPKPLETRVHGSHLVNSILYQTELVRDGSVLWLALPARQPLSHIARIWISRSMDDRDLMVKLLAVYGGVSRDADMETAAVFLQDGRLRLRLHPDMHWYKVNQNSLRLTDSEAWLDRIQVRGRDNHLVTFEGNDVVMRPIPTPPPDVAPPALPPRRVRRRRSAKPVVPTEVSDDTAADTP